MDEICLPGESAFAQMLEELAQVLKTRGWRLATAESCTGGWIAKCCTDLAGSSDWFERGFVTYSDQAKQEMLGVEPDVLRSSGAVSQEVARQMARGACQFGGVEVALSVTGIAGPGGGSAHKPVGTVWFGWSIHNQNAIAEAMHFSGDRKAVRRQTVGYSLSRLLELLKP